MSNLNSHAARVIETEIAGLNVLAQAMRDPQSRLAKAFDKAAAVCEKVKGRLIVTGIGKSGHVARKIAATLTSTGTPSNFMHPGEASHGDLGMISRDDAVLALSNSGETTELGDVIGYAGRFGVPLMAMTSQAGSTLARASDIALILPASPEACAVTRAPTTSTTMMLALGDALAVTVLQRRGFTADDFHSYHPGGRLGASLKRVRDLMHVGDLPLCSPDAMMAEAVETISTKGFGCVGVVDGRGVLVGMITDGDLRRHFSRSLSDTKAREIMTNNPLVLGEDRLAAEALRLLSEHKITSLFIVADDGRPVGILHVHDCLSTGVI